jgi:basic amino acid/polyamine antiporter, APA family
MKAAAPANASRGETAGASPAAPRRQLTLLDSVCLIVGIIVGAGIYQVGPDVAKGGAGPIGFLALWLAGGVLSLCGALGYAELAAAYPQAGGDYAYLTRAYGRWAGFLFGWLQLAIVRPGDIVVMAFAFATYAQAVWKPFAHSQQFYASLAVATLTLVNITGVRQGKWTQNLLTFTKVAGLAAIVLVAFLASDRQEPPPAAPALPMSLALIFVLFTYGGWNEMAYVAAEVVNPARNLLRTMILGMGIVTTLYLLVNGAFVYALGYSGVAQSQSVAVDAVSATFPRAAGVLISILICISALGAVNGLIFAGARISYALGRDYRLFRWLGRWNETTGTPVAALILQGVVALMLVCALGSFVNTLLYTAAPVYLFYLFTTLSVMVLRRKDPATPRPYRVWGYPLTPVVFGATCVFLAYSAVVYKPWIALSALGLLLAGLPLFWAARWFQKQERI